MPAFVASGLGWRPDLPDPRDYRPDGEEAGKVLGGLKRRSAPPKRVDWREYCPVADGHPSVSSGSASACVALLQYFQRRATGEIIEPSASFVDCTSHRLLARTGDGPVAGHPGGGNSARAGCACQGNSARTRLSRQVANLSCTAGCPCHGGEELRATWKAIVRFGVPRVEDWPCGAENVGREPDAFAYAAARKFPGLKYVRADGCEKSAEAVLESIKSFLAAGFALVFGFPVCTSVSADADIPYSTIFDGVRGGRAAMAVGYDDRYRVRSWRGRC